MKTNILKSFNIICIIAVGVLLSFLFVYGPVNYPAAYAETAPEVLQDLRKDKDFDESAYPYVKDDFGLYVIQIAESSNKELFIYVYQPCHDTYDLLGTKVSVSYGYSVDGSGLSPQLYNLHLVSTSGTLDKYCVQGFTVPNDGDRYYNIVEIFRIVNTEIDGEQDPAFPKTDIAYSVGQQWYACDLNDSKLYEMNTFNTLHVETVFNGSLYFADGITWGSFIGKLNPTDCWFYCFNQEEYVINHIYDAVLNYSIRHVHYDVPTELIYSNERENQVITLKDTDKMKYVSPGLGAPDLEWNRILSTEEFLKIADKQGVKMDSSVRENVLKSQWVFTYLETDKTITFGPNTAYGPSYQHGDYEDVYDVGLLRLHFQDTSGKYYDLGVVNSLTDPDNISDGGSETDLLNAVEEFWDTFGKAVMIILGVILLVVLLHLFPPLKIVLKFIFKAIVFVITLPIKILKVIFKDRKKQ